MQVARSQYRRIIPGLLQVNAISIIRLLLCGGCVAAIAATGDWRNADHGLIIVAAALVAIVAWQDLKVLGICILQPHRQFIPVTAVEATGTGIRLIASPGRYTEFGWDSIIAVQRRGRYVYILFLTLHTPLIIDSLEMDDALQRRLSGHPTYIEVQPADG